jgi:hypothetical protein
VCASVSCVATLLVVDDAVRRQPSTKARVEKPKKKKSKKKSTSSRKKCFFFFFFLIFLFPPSRTTARPGALGVRLKASASSDCRGGRAAEGYPLFRGSSLASSANSSRCFLVARPQSQSQLTVAAADAVPCRLFLTLSGICLHLRARVDEAWGNPRDVFEKFRLLAGPLTRAGLKECAAAAGPPFFGSLASRESDYSALRPFSR